MTRYYYTYFDRNYLIKGIALIESLQKHEKNNYTLFVICADELTRTLLNKLNYENVNTVPLHEIEKGDRSLFKAKRNRSLVEYYWSLKAAIALYILKHRSQIDILTYLDGDLFFYSSPEPIFKEFGDYSVLIYEHRFSLEQRFLEKFGKYNAGFLSFRNDTEGLQALQWWRDRCMEWCHGRLENGKYADQLYLNELPARYKNIAVLQNIGAGVAPWNHIQYRFDMDPASNNVMVNQTPLIFYHFHSLKFVEPRIIIPSNHTTNPLSKDILQLCFLPYIKVLTQAISKVRAILPDFTFGLITENAMNYGHTFLAEKVIANDLKGIALPHCKISLDSQWDCWCTEQLREYSSTLEQISDLISQENHTAAGVEIQKALSHFPDASDLLVLQTKLQSGESNRQAELEAILQKYPSSALAHNEIGVLLYEKGDKEKALHHYERAASLRSDNLIFQKNLANFYYIESGRLEDAKNLYLRIIAHVPNDINSLLTLGNIHIDLKEFDAAAEYFNCVHKIDPDNEIARRCLDILRQTSPVNAALESAEQKYEDIRPLMDAGKHDAVIRALEDILVGHPEFAIAHADLGVLYYNAGNLEKARMHYEKAVALQPQNPDFLRNLAAFYNLGLGEIESALNLYLKVLEIHPEDTEVLIILGNICAALQQFDDAEYFYNNVLTRQPWNNNARKNLETLTRKKQENAAAKTVDDMYRDIKPLMDEGRYKEVIQALSALLAGYPDFALAHADLGVLYYNEGNPEKARIHYEKAAQLEPDNLSFQKNLATFYYQGLGQLEDALQIFLKMMEINPKDIETLLNLGNICQILENGEDANFFYNQVLTIDPANESVRKYLQETNNIRPLAVN